ncbi:ataxin-10-like [Oppia nitens]|uniref:ataxin-10-like n=1 Tax=Oppia nitens TaxID=1686743 RepID=UPI0023DA1FEF|nr:ataxin-10-like [Oppia nitens]
MDKLLDQLDTNLIDMSSLLLTLQQITDHLKHEDNRLNLSQSHNNWQMMSSLLTKIGHEMTLQDNCLLTHEECRQVLTQLFRLLRNSLVDCFANKMQIITNGSILETSFSIFNQLISNYKSIETLDTIDAGINRKDLIQTMKCCLQFFGNLLSGLNDTNQDLIHIKDKLWSLFAFDLFSYLLDFKGDDSIILISSMILYSCLHKNLNIMVKIFEKNEDLTKILNILDLLLKVIHNSGSEWCLWTLQLFFSCNNFMTYFYNRFQIQQKILILDIMYEFIKSDKQFNANNLNDNNIDYLCQLFKQDISNIYEIDSQTNDNQIQEEIKYKTIHVSKMLSVLCEITTIEPLLLRLQCDRQLLECLVHTLKTIQLLSKTQENSHFKEIPHLRQINESDCEAQNPVFGFKRDLIRIIGNLVFKCQQMQDWVREFDGIPVILDCCNIDAKNPYIMQWSIFAIRNIVEGNDTNQQLLSQLSRNGILVNDKLMQKLAFYSVN